MFERFSPQARDAVRAAQDHARRLGHRFVGCEHLLLAVAGGTHPVGVLLRGAGLTCDRIETEIARHQGRRTGGHTPTDDTFGPLDRAALAAIGIDLEAVLARIDASFSAGAMARGERRDRGRGVWRGASRRGHLGWTDRAKQSLAGAIHQARTLGDDQIGVEHLALALLGTRGGPVPALLAVIGASEPGLRTAILNEYRRAS